jgi:uncharacterized protein YkwD
MKKLLAILLVLSMLLLCACSASDSSGNSSPSGGDNPDSSYTTTISQTESEDTLESRFTAEEGPENSSDTTSVSDRDEKNQEGNDPGVKPGSNQSQSTTGKDNPKETLPSQSSGDDNSSESSKPTEATKPTETTKPQTEPTQKEPETTQPPAEETVPEKPRAGRNDTAAVAQRVLEYINQYRSSPATRLSGLTEYAQYRSRQLVSNFAHDTADQRAAATALQYGEYVDPSVFGGSGQPYYRANAREAIAKAGYVGTIDEVAMKLATLVKNSPNHWNYIGDSQYCYIAVGVTYESDMWYCAITVASENTDEY